jgi:chromate transporter
MPGSLSTGNGRRQGKWLAKGAPSTPAARQAPAFALIVDTARDMATRISRLGQDEVNQPRRDSLGSIFTRFLKFGALAFGGPAAQIAMIKHECVDEEGWVSEETFKKTLAVYQVLPGPEAHELCVYFGRLRGGKLGGFLAGLGFMLPGFVLMLALSVLYVEAEISEELSELFYGLAAAVGAIVARALVRLGGSFITDVVLALIAVAAFMLTAFASVSFVLVLAGGGIAYELWTNAGRYAERLRAISLVPAALLVLAGAVTFSLTTKIFLEGLKAGLLTFGGAFTVIPFLQESAVQGQGWLTNSQFVDGLAMSGVLPAPLIIFSTFVGYIAGGLAGGLAMTLGIFLPAFVFPIFLHRWLVAVAENPRIRPFLLGVAAAVVGLIGAVTVDIVETGVVDVPTALLALGAFAALMRFHAKLTVLYVVLGCGLVGVALQLTVV